MSSNIQYKIDEDGNVLYTVKQAASRINYSHNTIRQYVSQGKIGSVMIGPHRFIPEPDLRNFAKASGVAW